MNIEIANQQDSLPLEEVRLRKAIRSIATQAGYSRGEISLAVITDAAIHRLNREHLNHDYATDVLSFVFERTDDCLEGEIIVSAEMAISTAHELGWPAEHELLLYVIHGMLHLVGYDDKQPTAREEMRAAEREAIWRFGITLPGQEPLES